MHKKNNLTKKYLRCLKDCFPIYGKQEKEYLKKIELHLEEYVSFHPDATYETLVSEFGSPTSVVSEYFNALEDEYLFKQLTHKRYFRFFVKPCITLIILLLFGSIFLVYNDIYTSKNQRISYEFITIKELEE